MTEPTVLKRAIDKAIDNDWWPSSWWMNVFKSYKYDVGLQEWSSKTDNVHLNVLIYDHGFAKALWPEGWKSHLQHMVVAEEPLDYLKDNT